MTKHTINQGEKVNLTEQRRTRDVFIRPFPAGLKSLACLAGLLRTQGSGAPAPRPVWLRGLILAALMTALCLLYSAPALAAAPEAPEEVTVQAPVHATTATFHGFLNPKAPGELGTYEFLYKQSPTECTGGSKAPASPGISLGTEHEEVSETVTGLLPSTTYTVCLLARNGTKVGENEALSTPPVTFTTATPSEKPKTEPASGETSSTAVLHGVLNPTAEAETGWYFAYSPGANCTSGGPGSGETAHETPAKVKALVVEPTVGGLEPNQKYKVCLLATNTAEEVTVGNEQTALKTLPLPPEIAGESASGVKAAVATLEAQVNPNNEATGYTFEYSEKENGAGVLEGAIVKVKDTSPVEGYPAQTVSVPTGVLEAGKTYFYRVVAENAQSVIESKPVVFPVPPAVLSSFTTVPTPTTEAVTAPTATTATFNGHLTPLNPLVATQYHFNYNLGGGACTGEHGTPTGEAGTGAGTEVAEHAEVTGLQPNHEYTVCFVTQNGTGASQEAPPVHFTTAAVVLEIAGESISGVTPSEATLEAKVNPNNQKTTYTFEYATSPALTGATVLPGAALEGFGPQTASAPTGAVLTVGETYYYRVVVTNTETSEVLDGTIQSFTPQGAPLVSAGVARSITDTTVALTGSVNPAGAETKYHVAYVDAAEYEPGALDPYVKGQTTLEASAGAGNTAVAVGPLELVNLSPGTTYHYRIVASNENGGTPQTVYGPDETFTTASTPPTLSGASVSAVTQSAATLSATLQAMGLQTRWELQLGSTPHSLLFQAAGSTAGSGAEPIVVNVGSLAPGTTYYYRLIAVNPDGQAETPEGSFTTAPAPAAGPTPPAVPLLTLPNVSFPAEAAQSATITPKKTAACPRGKVRKHNKCVKRAKAKKSKKGKK